MNIRRRSHIVILTGLLLALTACAGSAYLPAGHTPTVNPSTPILTATTQPSPTPTPFGGASAQLGPLPQKCPPGPIFTPKYLEPAVGTMLGAGPVWISGIGSYKQVPLALDWSPPAKTQLTMTSMDGNTSSCGWWPPPCREA